MKKLIDFDELWDYVDNDLLTNISIVNIEVNDIASRLDLDKASRNKFVINVFVFFVFFVAVRVVVNDEAFIVKSRRENLKIVTFLQNRLRYNDKNLIKNELDIKKTWKILKKTFLFKKFEILNNFMNIFIFIILINSKDVTNYVRRFKQELQNVREISTKMSLFKNFYIYQFFKNLFNSTITAINIIKHTTSRNTSQIRRWISITWQINSWIFVRIELRLRSSWSWQQTKMKSSSIQSKISSWFLSSSARIAKRNFTRWTNVASNIFICVKNEIKTSSTTKIVSTNDDESKRISNRSFKSIAIKKKIELETYYVVLVNFSRRISSLTRKFSRQWTSSFFTLFSEFWTRRAFNTRFAIMSRSRRISNIKRRYRSRIWKKQLQQEMKTSWCFCARWTTNDETSFSTRFFTFRNVFWIWWTSNNWTFRRFLWRTIRNNSW